MALSPDAPAYARELELRALRAEAALAALEDGCADLRRYVSSDKFVPTDGFRHGHVNVADVILRLDEASFAASIAVPATCQACAERPACAYCN